MKESKKNKLLNISIFFIILAVVLTYFAYQSDKNYSSNCEQTLFPTIGENGELNYPDRDCSDTSSNWDALTLRFGAILSSIIGISLFAIHRYKNGRKKS